MKKNLLILNFFEIIILFIISITISRFILTFYTIISYYIIIYYILLCILQIEIKNKIIIYLKYLVPISFSIYYLITNYYYPIETKFISIFMFIIIQIIFIILEHRLQFIKSTLNLFIFNFSISCSFLGLFFLQYAFFLRTLSITDPGSETIYINIGYFLIIFGIIGIIYSLIRSLIKSTKINSY